ncbi:trypsin-like serine peptidase [Scleromatobacter humisilvae]|uniref:Serine protease n=1 Tax=Scleromatobacter humisilvae TaxID=2897159 RepID=A0A9X1YG50_9BURK|nr:hypothetical protein [Scleromatobacter humisilvae]MCK9684220.1 serine protease [Scleromatobacter humisilvae]
MSQPDVPAVSRGADVEIPSVKSLFVQTYFGETLLGSATCFLLSRTRDSHCALITNRHVVTGRHQDTGACLDTKHGALPDAVVIYFSSDGESLENWKAIRLPLYRPDGSAYWIEHPRLGERADVVALNLKWGSDVTKRPYYLDLALDRVEMIVSPAEPLSVIGFPFGLTSRGKFPIWATGFLAQDLSLVSADQPTFFIDCRSRPGQSGSPVIAFRPSGARVKKDGKAMLLFNSLEVKWEFLGIYSGRVNSESDLGVVWHVSALGELLDAAAQDLEQREALGREIPVVLNDQPE